MVFVDGENLTLRGQDVMKARGLQFTMPEVYERDVFCWLPTKDRADRALFGRFIHMGDKDREPIRAYYYTTCPGDQVQQDSVKERLFALGFHAEVFHKPKGGKAKAVDITLARDMLVHAFRDNYDTAFLIAGDRDYQPLVEEVKRVGKNVFVCFFESTGLSKELRLSSDRFWPLEEYFGNQWSQHQPAPLPPG